MTRTIRRTSMICMIVFTVPSGCVPVGPGGASDVPWVKPEAFSNRGPSLLARLEAEEGDVLLLTHQTNEQRHQDGDDGVLGNGPHEAVYSMDTSTGSSELVGDEVWDESDGLVTDCGPNLSRSTPFTTSGARLHFEGRLVPIQGRALIAVKPARYSPVIAALTSEGEKSILYALTGGAPGQHYHQVFSEVDGRPLGKAVRIPIVTSQAHHRICWTRDEGYVIYSQSGADGRGYDLLAVAPVAEEVALANGGGDSDVPCLRPTAWFSMEGRLLLRSQTEGSDTLLLTHENDQQHGPVYRLAPSTEDFELVEDEVWDHADGTVTVCRDNQYRPVAFTVTEDHRLTLDGQPIEVAGGSVAYTFGVPDRPAVAVLSTDGLPYDFETHHGFTGQYYHQLFSETDGRPLGEPLRVAVGGARKFVRACRTEDERFVVYHQDLYSRADDRSFLCVVRMADELTLLEGEPAP